MTEPKEKKDDKKTLMKAEMAREALKEEDSVVVGDGKNSAAGKTGETTSPKEVLSAKYFRMKYEIEMQNYLIEKMNRELQSKMIRCRPPFELCQLRQKLNFELRKLDRMIEFAINMQRSNPDEKWGPIAISTVEQSKPARSHSCPLLGKQPKLPKTPSGVSLVSGFDELEDILLNEEEENCQQQKSTELKELKIREFCSKMGEMAKTLKHLQEERLRLEAQGCNRNIKCEDLFNMNSAVSATSDDEVLKSQLEAVEEATKKLRAKVDEMKLNIKKLLNDFTSLKQS